MKKNNLSRVILIPLIVMALAIVGVFTYKLYSEGTRAKAVENESVLPKNLPGLKVPTGKPNTRYGALASPTPTPALTSIPKLQEKGIDLDQILKESSEEATMTDFTSINKSISGL